jgi:hypothetical protein
MIALTLAKTKVTFAILKRKLPKKLSEKVCSLIYMIILTNSLKNSLDEPLLTAVKIERI